MSSSIFNLLPISSALASGDVLPIVDVSDSTQSPQGSTVKITQATYFSAIPVAVGISSTLTITSASASALAVGLAGATNPAFAVDASTASQAAGLKVTGAATGGTVAIAATDSGSNTNLTLNAKGTGTIQLGSVSTGAITLARATGITGALTVTSNASAAVAAGPNGATNPVWQIDGSTASQAAGLKLTGAVTGGSVALAVIDSGAAANLTIDAKGTGTIGIGSVSTGAVTVTPATNVVGTFTVNTNKFSVNASTGAAVFAGALSGITTATISTGLIFSGNPSTVKSGAANGIQLQSSASALLQQWYDNGITFLQGVGTTTSAGAGEMILANAKSLRGVNAAGTDTLAIAQIDASNNVKIAPGAQTTVCGYNLKLTGGAFDGVAYTMLYVLGGLGTGGSGLGTSAVNVYSQSSITTAKEVATPAGAVFVYVYGSDGAGSNQFLDVVVTTYGTSAPTVLSSTTLAGTPTARTYTNPVAGSLNLAMASGTYNTRALWWYLERR